MLIIPKHVEIKDDKKNRKEAKKPKQKIECLSGEWRQLLCAIQIVP